MRERGVLRNHDVLGIAGGLVAGGRDRETLQRGAAEHERRAGDARAPAPACQEQAAPTVLAPRAADSAARPAPCRRPLRPLAPARRDPSAAATSAIAPRAARAEPQHCSPPTRGHVITPSAPALAGRAGREKERQLAVRAVPRGNRGVGDEHAGVGRDRGRQARGRHSPRPVPDPGAPRLRRSAATPTAGRTRRAPTTPRSSATSPWRPAACGGTARGVRGRRPGTPRRR